MCSADLSEPVLLSYVACLMNWLTCNNDVVGTPWQHLKQKLPMSTTMNDLIQIKKNANIFSEQRFV